VPLPGKAPEMVVIAAGRFFMGSPKDEKGRDSDEDPQHGVAVVKPFAMSRCEVTVAEFRAFVLETQYQTDNEKKSCDWRSPGFEQKENHPVVCVSWRDARAYAYWLSLKTGQKYRLPTEAEWEYAARAGTSTAYNFGDDAASLQEYAWFFKNSNDQTQPVANKKPNPWGLYDMHGNVWEWTADCRHGDYSDAPYDGSAWLEGAGAECDRRVIRGGSWCFLAVLVRSASRNGYTTDGTSNNISFRIARALF